MNKKTNDKIFLSLRALSKLILVHSFIIIYVAIGGYIVIDLFVTRKQDSISLTYYGFAIFAAFANICFSYSRTLEVRDNQIYVRGIGERFLFSALGFLIGSVLNYVSINSVKLFKKPPINVYLTNACELVGAVFFAFSFFLAAVTVHSLLDHLFERTMLNKDNYFIEKKVESVAEDGEGIT